MGCKWIKCNHHIAIEDKEEILHPSAEEVFSFVTGENIEYAFQNPVDVFQSIHFSQIGSPAKCRVYSDSNGTIWLEIYAIRKNQKWQLDVIQGHIIDHCISDKEWFYISNDLSSLETFLNNAGIETAGEISKGQYISLLRQEFFSKNQEIQYDVDPTAFSLIKNVIDVPKGLCANLYQYQKTGCFWIIEMLNASHGCILGDEMGLGKTLQVIAVFQHMKETGSMPVLVVAPVSLLENWRRECLRFAPKLDVYLHHGAKRTGRAYELIKHDVVIISYNTAVSDLSLLKMIQWNCVVLDEAQNIKNPESDRAKSVKAITRNNGIAVTGTPFENHITDIWSIVDFIIPGLLGSLSDFTQSVSDDVLGAEKLEPILSPILLRRLVSDVAVDLPEKIIIPQPMLMSDDERMEYEQYRREARDVANMTSVSVGVLQKLRMFCTHRLLCRQDKTGDPAETSVKYQRFCELIEEIIAQKEKVIVFTSFKKMFEIISDDIPRRFSVPVDCINGDTPVEDRQKIVDWFNGYSNPAVLVLNPRAAGTGLNITGANHVIHYNLEWNPALEDQASARAFRRGQEKTVFIYRLFYEGTVEQVVNERIERKRTVSSTVVVGTDGNSDQNDIIRALELVPALLEKGR